MDERSSVKLRNSFSQSLRIIVEPWATEFLLPLGSECQVVSVGGADKAEIDIELVLPSKVIFSIETPGAVYEYWQDGVLVD